MAIDRSKAFQAFKEGAATHVKIICSKKTYSSGEDPMLYYYDDDISMDGGIVYSEYSNPDIDLHFGNFIGKEITINFIKKADMDRIKWTSSVKVYFSVDIEGVQSDYVWIGDFAGNEPTLISSNGIDILVFTGYKKFLTYGVYQIEKMDEVMPSITFPITLKNMCTALSQSLFQDQRYLRVDDAFENITINENPFPVNTSVKQGLLWIAEFVCCNLTGWNFESFEWNNGSPSGEKYCLDPDSYFQLNFSGIQVPGVPAVQYIDSADSNNNESYPSTYTGIPYKIIDNPIYKHISAADKTLNLQIQKEQYLNYEYHYDNPMNEPYYPMDVYAVGNFLIGCTDFINIEDETGTIRPMRIFSRVMRWNGALTDEYHCTGNLVRQGESDYEKRVEEIQQVLKVSTADNLITTTKGLLLDASQGKVLNDKLSQLEFSVTIEQGRTGSARAVKCSNVCSVSIYISSSIGKGGWKTVGHVPTGYRPYNTTDRPPVAMVCSASVDAYGMMRVNFDGTIEVFFAGSGNTTLNGFIAYICEQ